MSSAVGRKLKLYQENNFKKNIPKQQKIISADLSLCGLSLYALCTKYSRKQSVILQKNLISNIYSADKYQNMKLTLFGSFGISSKTM